MTRLYASSSGASTHQPLRSKNTTVANHPANSAIGFLVLLAGVPACRYWQRANRVS